MANQIFRKKTLLAKKEATYGVDSAPTGPLNAIQTRNLSIEPLNGDQLEFDVDNGNLGSPLATMVGKHVRVTFQVAFGGSGDAGTAPAYGVLLEACGHSVALVADTSATYTPKDTDTDSVTLHVLIGRTLHKITGARGSVQLSTSKRNYPWLEFSFMGLFGTVTDQTLSLGAVYSAFIRPLPFRASSVEFELGEFVAGLHELTINFGQQVEFYEHSESEQIMQVDRRGSWQGSIEAPDVTTKNYFTAINADTDLALEYTHGTVAGNIAQVLVPKTQLLQPTYSDQQGIIAMQLQGPLGRVGDAADYTIVFT